MNSTSLLSSHITSLSPKGSSNPSPHLDHRTLGSPFRNRERVPIIPLFDFWVYESVVDLFILLIRHRGHQVFNGSRRQSTGFQPLLVWDWLEVRAWWNIVSMIMLWWIRWRIWCCWPWEVVDVNHTRYCGDTTFITNVETLEWKQKMERKRGMINETEIVWRSAVRRAKTFFLHALFSGT